MALNFPSSPSLNEVYTSGDSSWTWNGTTWNSNAPVGTSGFSGYSGSGISGFSGFSGYSGASAAGGGGLTNWTDSVTAGTRPTSSIKATNAATDVSAAIAPKGNGALIAAIPDNTSTGGNGRGMWAVDLQLIRSASTQVASQTCATIGGGLYNTCNALYSTIAGGQSNTINPFFMGQGAVISGGQYNSITTVGGTNTIGGGSSNSITSGTQNTIGGGSSNTISGTSDLSSITGGDSNTASGICGSILGGSGNAITSSANYAAITGGISNRADASCSIVLGGASGTTRGIIGSVVMPASFNPVGYSRGNQQLRYLIVGGSPETTSTRMRSDGEPVSNTNQLYVPVGCAYYVVGSAVAFSIDLDAAKQWEFKCLVKNSGSGIVIVGSPSVTSTFGDSSASAWSLAISADSINNCLAVDVVGDAVATRCVCKISTVEVSF